MRFKDKVLFVTGGASGIGATVARRFTAEGGDVAVVDLAGDRAEAVAADISGAVGLAADVSDEASVASAVAAAVDHFGGIDCVFNAGGHAEFGPIEEWSPERFMRMLAVHVGGTFLVCKHVLPSMRARGGGSIVNVASVAALVGQHGNSAYGAAKGGVLSFTRQFARDVAPDIRVNVVAPGRTRTGMTEPLMVARGGGDVEAGAAAFGQGNLMKRVADPEELAAPVCFLLSDEASFMTGAVVVVDGGETAI